MSIIDMKQRPDPEARLVHLNIVRHIQTPESGQLADVDNRFNWYEVLKAPDRRSYFIKQIEGRSGCAARAPRHAHRCVQSDRGYLLASPI